MFLSDNIPILINLPSSKEYVDIYFVHDLHYGSELFNEKKWKAVKEMILHDENAVVCFVGDMMENAIPNSKICEVINRRLNATKTSIKVNPSSFILNTIQNRNPSFLYFF